MVLVLAMDAAMAEEASTREMKKTFMMTEVSILIITNNKYHLSVLIRLKKRRSIWENQAPARIIYDTDEKAVDFYNSWELVKI